MPVVHGGATNVELSFDAVASKPRGEMVELKVCECCSRRFFRPVTLPMRLREKLCGECRKRRQRAAGVQ